MTAGHGHSFEGIVLDVVRRPEPPRPVGWLSPAEKAAELMRIQADRARRAARENEVMLGFAADRPDDADPPADHPGARSRNWRVTDPEFPGVSESFPQELALVLGVGRGTAAHRLRRAWTLRHSLPATEAAQARGVLDERRGQILGDTLAHTDPALAGRVEAVVLPEAALLGFGQLKRRILEVLLELDPATAEENRSLADKDAEVFCEPDRDGTATLGARLAAGEAAEGYDFINSLAEMAKADGDPRPIGQLRHEIFSLLVRGAAIGAAGARATLTITAALEALEGTSSRPGDVNGFAITPAQLRSLLARLEAVDLTIAVTDADGRPLATLTLTELQRAVQRGEGATTPPPTDSYPPTTKQRRFVTTRDRSCRMPFCGQRAGWADHDHVVPHAAGGPTTCTNLTLLCLVKRRPGSAWSAARSRPRGRAGRPSPRRRSRGRRSA